MAEKLARLWRRLPGWLRTAIVVGAAMLAFEFVPRVGDLSAGGILISALAAGLLSFVLFVVAVRQSVGEASPADIVASAEKARDAPGRGRGRVVLVAVLTVVALGLIWGIGEILDRAEALPDDSSKGRMFGHGAALLLAGMGAPFLLVPAALALGRFLPPVTMRARYRLRLDAPVAGLFARRAALDSVPDIVTGLRRAERVADSDPPHFVLRPDGLGPRLLGMGQVTAVESLDPDRHLVLDTVTEGGDREVSRYWLAADAGPSAPVVECETEARLGSAFIKGFVRVVGVPRLARGAAEVEARRFSRLTGVPATVAEVLPESG